MHSKEDEEPRLAPENDEAEIAMWRDRFAAENNRGYASGKKEGWAEAVEALREIGQEQAADELEAYRQRALDRA